MAKRTFYLTTSADANGWGALSETAQAAATTASGWTVSTGATNHSELEVGVERAASTFTGTTVPDGTLDTTLKDALRVPSALTETYAPGACTFNFAVIAVTNGGSQDGRMRFRVIRADADGSNAVEITSAQQQGSLVTNLATGAAQTSSLTVDLPRFTITNQYLFFQLAWERTGAGGMSNSDVLLRTGTSTNGTKVLTSDIETAGGAFTGSQIPGGDYFTDVAESALYQRQVPGWQYVNETQLAVAGGVTYPQLERGIRGMTRGLVTGSFR